MIVKLKVQVHCLLSIIGVLQASPVLPNYDIWGNSNAKFNENKTNNIESTRNPKVLNFFALPDENECLASDGRRKGICLNTYECRIQGGKSFGSCAFGFGVCCVFTASCDKEVFNNITYFVNPDFPSLSRDMTKCTLKVKKVDSQISQFRLDFLHFHLGQPNRRTGVCDDDIFVMSGGNTRELRLCGLNSGQHVYFDVENVDEPISISMNLRKRGVGRLWEVRVIQIPMNQRAPAGCLQYHTGKSGALQTMNFAENGRHLADQDYTICMRQEMGMCSIAYEPCDENSFKIGSTPGGSGSNINGGLGSSTNGGTGGIGGSNGGTGGIGGSNGGTGGNFGGGGTPSAGNPGIIGEAQQPGGSMQPPMTVADLPEEFGSGEMPVESRMCSDRIIMPCDSEDLIMPGSSGAMMCDLIHCGTSFCADGGTMCRVESSILPFTIGVQFGPGARDGSPDDNLGMCLRYEQLPCVV